MFKRKSNHQIALPTVLAPFAPAFVTLTTDACPATFATFTLPFATGTTTCFAVNLTTPACDVVLNANATTPTPNRNFRIRIMIADSL
jgi:hypothetical protein